MEASDYFIEPLRKAEFVEKGVDVVFVRLTQYARGRKKQRTVYLASYVTHGESLETLLQKSGEKREESARKRHEDSVNRAKRGGYYFQGARGDSFKPFEKLEESFPGVKTNYRSAEIRFDTLVAACHKPETCFEPTHLIDLL